MRRWFTAAVILGLLAPPAGAQLLEFCQLTHVKIKHLPNGVSIRLVADGVIKVAWDPLTYWRQEESGEWVRKRMRRFPFLLQNVRGAPASTVPVGIYPVSHLEFAVPPGARESVGLICTIVLYKPGSIGFWSDISRDRRRGLERDRNVAPIRVDLEPSRTRRELLIFVTSDRPYEPPPQRQKKITAAPGLEVRWLDGRLWVSSVNADLHELIERVSFVAGVPVFLDDQVQRRASLQLDGVTLDEFLSSVAAAYGLCLTQTEGAYFITAGVPDSAAAFWASQVKRIPLHHISPESALYSLPDILLKYVHAHPEANSLVVAGPAPLVDKVARDVAELDKPVWYTRLRTWVIECTGTAEQLQEIQWSLSGGTTSAEMNSHGSLSLSVAGARPRELLVRLSALRTKGLAKVRACPSIAIANGQWGELFVGEKQHFWRIVPLWRGRQEIRLTTAEAGIRLACRPHTGGGPVTMLMVLQSDSFVSRTLPPAVERRRLVTTLRIGPGDSVIAGGMSVEYQAAQVRRPWPRQVWPNLGALATGRSRHRLTRQMWIILEARARQGEVPRAWGGGQLAQAQPI